MSEKARRDLCDTYCPHQDKVARYKDRVLEVAGLSELFRVLGDETRTKILYLLSEEEFCVCDLATILDMSLPAISHHLRLLRTMRLVKHRREGRMVYYSLADSHILELIRQAQEHFEEER
ncbi:MAG: ArsR/SmtB family transcription factor [Limnochordia bacterium]|jgi:DNA-binding transcriptional ArsR family regulator|nr:helix-turn-helix transcriptional regulator [Bacillota bacterium]